MLKTLLAQHAVACQILLALWESLGTATQLITLYTSFLIFQNLADPGVGDLFAVTQLDHFVGKTGHKKIV
jgi:hypothetical protein